ncbi:methyltransferase domain-containing protein [Paenibacillus filicis]|uniref:Methyltransferase domain-containing protein n=1 Tax=Paenibacillus gyeongsangnamensis TaxID=3388067 RepID=A0ABT4QCI5_9BACL|nr:methyltransferase domain-containing protein [Paenibacillus filicis]MCZ8514561.1 methyltransferase domain-containing protein [Paenibacillus filicis]
MDNKYSILQLSKLSGLSTHTLRYYEKAGLLDGIGRSGSGYRVYQERDLAWVQLLAQLRKTNMPISRLQQLARWRTEGSGTLADRRQVLEQHREEVRLHIEELQMSLRQLERRIGLYQALEQDAPPAADGEDAGMKAYYAQRAEHYERIYYRDDPIRQTELAAMEADLCRTLADRRVLEVACGTGFWTQKAVRTAACVTATDVTPETIAIARSKAMPADKVTFLEGDAYRLQEVPGSFDAALAMFWFSHVPKAQIPIFLEGLHSRIGPGEVMFIADNMFIPGIGGELIVRPGEADTYKQRELTDGSKHEVLKNYFTEQELEELFGPLATELRITMGECFWQVSYTIK